MLTTPRPLDGLNRQIARWLAPRQTRFSATSHELLRLSLGFVFLMFGALKFIPGMSPAEDIAVRAVSELSFGLVTGGTALLLVALMETAIGLSLLTGRALRFGVALLGAAMVGILSPLVLFPGELFAGPYFAPTLIGQYVLKDVVLLAAALVIAVRTFGRQPMERPDVGRSERVPTPRPAPRLDLDRRQPNHWLVAMVLVIAVVVGTLSSMLAVQL